MSNENELHPLTEKDRDDLTAADMLQMTDYVITSEAARLVLGAYTDYPPKSWGEFVRRTFTTVHLGGWWSEHKSDDGVYSFDYIDPIQAVTAEYIRRPRSVPQLICLERCEQVEARYAVAKYVEQFLQAIDKSWQEVNTLAEETSLYQKRIDKITGNEIPEEWPGTLLPVVEDVDVEDFSSTD